MSFDSAIFMIVGAFVISIFIGVGFQALFGTLAPDAAVAPDASLAHDATLASSLFVRCRLVVAQSYSATVRFFKVERIDDIRLHEAAR